MIKRITVTALLVAVFSAQPFHAAQANKLTTMQKGVIGATLGVVACAAVGVGYYYWFSQTYKHRLLIRRTHALTDVVADDYNKFCAYAMTSMDGTTEKFSMKRLKKQLAKSKCSPRTYVQGIMNNVKDLRDASDNLDQEIRSLNGISNNEMMRCLNRADYALDRAKPMYGFFIRNESVLCASQRQNDTDKKRCNDTSCKRTTVQ